VSEVLALPQHEQDLLYDFYCTFGNFDKDGKHVGLFRRAAAVIDNSTRDIVWGDFVEGNLNTIEVAQDEVRSGDIPDRAAQVDAYFDRVE